MMSTRMLSFVIAIAGYKSFRYALGVDVSRMADDTTTPRFEQASLLGDAM
jgi:hypothetical protein